MTGMEMRTAGHNIAVSAIKIFNQQRRRIPMSLRDYVKNECRQDKTGKMLRRQHPNQAWDFWRGVDDALAGIKRLHSGGMIKICHKCDGAIQCEHLPNNMNWVDDDNSSN